MPIRIFNTDGTLHTTYSPATLESLTHLLTEPAYSAFDLSNDVVRLGSHALQPRSRLSSPPCFTRRLQPNPHHDASTHPLPRRIEHHHLSQPRGPRPGIHQALPHWRVSPTWRNQDDHRCAMRSTRCRGCCNDCRPNLRCGWIEIADPHYRPAHCTMCEISTVMRWGCRMPSEGGFK
jgi:hypothetical protein